MRWHAGRSRFGGCAEENAPAMPARPPAERAARPASARCGATAASRALNPPRARASESARPSP
ncbi:hypothetical protein A8H35_17515 [Burkholderia thailandensis]|nr:hypothetical protein A8H35_17515 [Burkholderia thailandensis]AWY68994.1 hypothetical protein A8H36_29750 [Burkholderia thailandensis]PHH38265.1 hypothetical protein CRX59_17865 [Burkholderia thailandensis]